MEMINGSSEGALDKATRAGKTEKIKNLFHLCRHLCWATVLPMVYKLREKGDEITFTHCASHSSPLFNSSGNIQTLGKRTCHTTLSLSSKDRLLCNATVLCDKRLISIQPPFLFLSVTSVWYKWVSFLSSLTLLPAFTGADQRASRQIIGSLAHFILTARVFLSYSKKIER